MRQRLEAATAAVIDVLERYDLTVMEVDELVRSITNRFFTLSGTVRVRNFKDYQIDAHGEVIKPAEQKPAEATDGFCAEKIRETMNDSFTRRQTEQGQTFQ